MDQFISDEVKSKDLEIPANSGGGELVINGNDAYSRLLGYILLILKADGTPFTGKAKVSLTTSQGFVLLPSQPYHCIRPSFQERYQDRIIKINGVKGHEQDFRFRVEASVNEALTATAVAYFSRK